MKELVSESAYGSVSRKLSDILFDGSESTKVSLHALDVLKLGKDYCRTPVDPILLQHVMTVSQKPLAENNKREDHTKHAVSLLPAKDRSSDLF